MFETQEYLLMEKDRLIKKFGCQTIEEVMAILEKKIAEKQAINLKYVIKPQ